MSKIAWSSIQATLAADSGLGIARGSVTNFSHINKFGFNATVGSTFETVWDGSNVYSYPATAGVLLLTSSSGDDDNAVVEVQGLDENYNLVTVNHTIGEEGTQQFIRVFRMILKTPGAGQTTNVGVITARHTDQSSTQIDVAKILAGLGQTLMTPYTVPAGYQAYIVRFYATVDVKDKQATVIGMARPFGQTAFNTKAYFTSNGNTIDYDYVIPLRFGEKTDFEVRAKSPTGVGISATYDIILEKL